MHTAVRVTIAVLLLVVVAGAGVHYDTTQPTHWPYPTSDELADEYEPAVGEQTLLFGDVQSVDPADNSAVITVEHSTGAFNMRVTNVDSIVDPGGTIQVYGTLQPGHTINADAVVVVNPAGSATTYKYAVSAVGALLILVVFFHTWRIDRDDGGFVPRGD